MCTPARTWLLDGEPNRVCHSQETPQQTQIETAAEPSADSPAHVADQSNTDEPATSTPADVQTQPDAQPLPEEVLAAGLIPPDGGVSTTSEAAEELTADAEATDTLSKEHQIDVVQEAPQVQLAVPEGLAPASTSEGAELDPNSTAALIQVVALHGPVKSQRHRVAFVVANGKSVVQATFLERPYYVISSVSTVCSQLATPSIVMLSVQRPFPLQLHTLARLCALICCSKRHQVANAVTSSLKWATPARC